MLQLVRHGGFRPPQPNPKIFFFFFNKRARYFLLIFSKISCLFSIPLPFFCLMGRGFNRIISIHTLLLEIVFFFPWRPRIRIQRKKINHIDVIILYCVCCNRWKTNWYNEQYIGMYHNSDIPCDILCYPRHRKW